MDGGGGGGGREVRSKSFTIIPYIIMHLVYPEKFTSPPCSVPLGMTVKKCFKVNRCTILRSM